MCGRYSETHPIEKLQERFKAKNFPEDFRPQIQYLSHATGSCHRGSWRAIDSTLSLGPDSLLGERSGRRL